VTALVTVNNSEMRVRVPSISHAYHTWKG